jgi:hypothetical protein
VSKLADLSGDVCTITDLSAGDTIDLRDLGFGDMSQLSTLSDWLLSHVSTVSGGSDLSVDLGGGMLVLNDANGLGVGFYDVAVDSFLF